MFTKDRDFIDQLFRRMDSARADTNAIYTWSGFGLTIALAISAGLYTVAGSGGIANASVSVQVLHWLAVFVGLGCIVRVVVGVYRMALPGAYPALVRTRKLLERRRRILSIESRKDAKAKERESIDELCELIASVESETRDLNEKRRGCFPAVIRYSLAASGFLLLAALLAKFSQEMS